MGDAFYLTDECQFLDVFQFIFSICCLSLYMDHGLAPNTYIMTGQTIIVGANFVLSRFLLLIQYNIVQASQGQSKSMVGVICLLRKGLLKKILTGAFNHITFQKGLHQIQEGTSLVCLCFLWSKLHVCSLQFFSKLCH